MAILPGLTGISPVSTAATTSRLGLMQPVDSDLFQSSDFASSMEIIDAVPGTLPVANLAALQALNWTTAQHGSRVLQLDNGAEWYWYQPYGAGSWKRTNNVGLLSSATSTTAVATSTTGVGPTVVTTPTFTAPGVRPLRVDLRIGLDNNAGVYSIGGIGIVTILDNGNSIFDWNIRCGGYISSNGTSFNNQVLIVNPTPGSSHQISVQVRCSNTSYTIGGRGTVTARETTLTVTEV